MKKQISMFKPQVRFFGGALLVGKRKSMRPLSKKEAIHFVLRSEFASGKDSFLAKRNKYIVEQIINKFAEKFGVKIYRRAVTGNHIHLLLRITNRTLYRAFIKAVSGKIASHVMGGQSFATFLRSRRGDGYKKRQSQVEITSNSEGFWQFRPFSRIVSWGRDFKGSVSYLKQNLLEAFGFVPYTPRKNYYAKYLFKEIPELRLQNTS